MKDKLITYLGFATKSGNVIYGVDNIIAKSSKVIVAIFDEKLSNNSKNKLTNCALRNDVKLYKSNINLDDLLNKTNCKAIGITSKDLAKAIVELNYLEEVRN